MEIGKRIWAIPEGYIPKESVDPSDPALVSHEAACLLNPSSRDATVKITVYFEDREPEGPYRIALPARRTKHVRFNNFPIPHGVPYASLIESDVPIVVQHTRLDSRNPAIALLSTIAFPVE